MERRRLGGFDVSAIGLGCMGMSSAYAPVDRAEAVATLRAALDRGVELFDTADIYGDGHNETLLGEIVVPAASDARIATKVGNVARPNGPPVVNGRPGHIARACEASLKRLGVDRIDLYYLHRVDPDVPIEETVGAMARLVEAGKVREIGLSEAAPATLRRAHAVHPLAALQSEYSLWTRDPEPEILPLCAELGIAFVAYSPIGRGFLSARLRRPDALGAEDRRRAFPRFSDANWAANDALLDALEAIAGRLGATPAQIAIAWTLHKSPIVLPIPGSSRRAHLAENLDAGALRLNGDDMAALDRAFPPGAAAGARFGPAQMKKVGL